MKKKYIVRLVVVALVAVLATGCQSIRELHYFKDKAGNPPNYYRLSIRGRAFLSSSRYLSGYFDEEAVNYYFGEITQPKDGKFDPSGAPTAPEQEPEKNGIVSVDNALHGKKYVLLLSTNSDAISSAFGSFVESKETQEELAQVLNQQHAKELSSINADQTLLTLKQTKLTTLGENFLGSLTDTTPNAEITINMLAYINATAAYFGSTETFTNLADATKWFKANRELILKNNQ